MPKKELMRKRELSRVNKIRQLLSAASVTRVSALARRAYSMGRVGRF
jgi:hypothetical protein